MSPPNIFASSPDVKAVVTLILIENSEAMRPSWGVLCQHYLPTFLGTMRKANPVIPIPVLWLVTAPVGEDARDLHSAPPRQYNQLPELKFNSSPDNKISSRIINKATELMLEAASQFQGGPVNFHLFIVAASTPAEGTWGVSLTMPTQIGQSEWRLLGQRMAQLQIHCHMILLASQNMSSMNELFLSNLELQGHTQVWPWFPSGPEYTFLLSGNPSPHDLHSIDQPDQQPFYAVARPPVLRHQSFPQDAQSAAVSPAPPPNDATPSLVSSLQKVHGLSRKKLYGTQPPRQPFVREEPVRAKYKSTPTPLSIPVGSQPFPGSEDGRAIGRTKIERGRRVDRPPHPGDLPNSTSPGRRCSWNRVASDVGSSPSSPNTSHSSHNTASPTIPLYPDLPVYTSPPTASAGFSPTMLSPEAGLSASLHDPSAGYFPVSPSTSFQPPIPSGVPVPSQGTPWTPMSRPISNPAMAAKSTETPSAAKRHSQELPHGSHVQSFSAMSSKYRLESVSTEPRPGPKNTQRVKDAGDVPFIFSPELEAATAAKLKAALQSTSPALSSTVNAFPPVGSGHGINYSAAENGFPAIHGHGSQSQSSTAPRPHGYTTTMDGCQVTALTNGHIDSSDGMPHARFGGGMSSSSLQGWAG